MKAHYRIERWRQPFAPNPAMLRRVLESEGYAVFQWCDQPQAIYGLHKHGEEQSHWIVSGKLELMIEAVGTFVLAAGDRDFMPAHTYHTARVISEEAVVYLIGEKLK
ncbi:MAG TPA: cupin domain-containing protein [Pyrinomonadaceae bacterium]|jgi:quercetin dioxygenase-like cupin family protein